MKPKQVAVKENIWGDGIAKVEHWDFSRSNLDEQSRIDAITTVASVCYDNPNVVGKESLYNRLKAESMGLPSSSFEFVPVLLNEDKTDLLYDEYTDRQKYIFGLPHSIKYGEPIQVDKNEYILTNYRALLHDFDVIRKNTCESDYGSQQYYPENPYWLNTEEECEIIRKHHNTFLIKMDIATSKQFNRHRVSLQELSRRYVSGKKTPFEFYISNTIKDIEDAEVRENVARGVTHALLSYYSLLDQGVQPQDARRILPQSMYTTVWSAWLPSQLKNFIELRTDKHSQWEIQQIAEAMKSLSITV